ncbi:MAG: glycosyltransferase family 4 protein, partial [Planctomycetes bacterium]|nr:glycosyltransferase family 4 protein [Planctomycetota bacterium]
GPLEGWVSRTYRGYRERLFERAQRPDLAGRVRFLGERDDVPALMAKAAVHACPSRPEMREGLPNVVLEAKQASLPTVAFAHGPFPELIEQGRDGWICPQVGPEELAEGLSQFLAAPERRDAAGSAARASLSRFSREQFARAWAEVFR